MLIVQQEHQRVLPPGAAHGASFSSQVARRYFCEDPLCSLCAWTKLLCSSFLLGTLAALGPSKPLLRYSARQAFFPPLPSGCVLPAPAWGLTISLILSWSSSAILFPVSQPYERFMTVSIPSPRCLWPSLVATICRR